VVQRKIHQVLEKVLLLPRAAIPLGCGFVDIVFQDFVDGLIELLAFEAVVIPERIGKLRLEPLQISN
jgi:hypothetical protein